MRIFVDDHDRSCGPYLAVMCLVHMFPVDSGIVFSVHTFQVLGRWLWYLTSLRHAVTVSVSCFNVSVF